MRTVKKDVIPAAQVFAEARNRPGYAEAYDALEEEFSLVTALIKARTNSGLTQAELAKRMNTTQAVIARLEAGGRRPSTRTLERLAKATGHRLEISFVPENHKRQRRASR
jgi:ribosome-binding protein aMBF1 (putative translation factor)